MKFYAYISNNEGPRLDYAGRDMDRGIIGTIYDPPEPIAECDTLDAAILAGNAHIGQNPAASVYIADENELLYKMLLCSQHHKSISDLHKQLFVAWTCSTFTTMSLLVTALVGTGVSGLALAVFAVGFYLFLIRINFMNEVESAMVALIFSALVFFAFPAIRAAWAAYQLRSG